MWTANHMPLVPDAPVNRMEPGVTDAWLDALVDVAQPRVIFTAHECQGSHHDVHALDEATLT